MMGKIMCWQPVLHGGITKVLFRFLSSLHLLDPAKNTVYFKALRGETPMFHRDYRFVEQDNKP
jgi:hypothetical protein